RGLARLTKEQFEPAIADCGKAIEFDTGNVEAFINRAAAYKSLNRSNEALADYDEAVRIAPRSKLALYGRAALCTKIGRASQAVADYTALIGIVRGAGGDGEKKELAMLLALRADAHLSRNDTGDAIADCTEAIGLNPGSIAAYEVRSRAYEKRGDSARAEQDRVRAAMMRGG